MAQSLRNVVLIGASGTIGTHILSALLDDKDFNITILTRPESKATFPGNVPDSKVIKIEYNFENFVKVFEGQDAVVSATGVQSIAIQKDLIRAAHKAGVKRFVLNDFINSPNQPGLSQLEVFRQPRIEIRQFAETLAKKDAHFTWSALATGNFIDYSLEKYPVFGFDIRQRTARLIDNGKEPITASTLPDIGIAVCGILRRPSETANRYLHIRSTETTQQRILEAFEEVSGSKWVVEHASSDQLYAEGVEMFAKGNRNGMLNLLVVQLFQYGANRSIVVAKDKSDNELLGVEEKDVKDIVKRVWKTVHTGDMA